MPNESAEGPSEEMLLGMGSSCARDTFRHLRDMGFGESELRTWLHGFLTGVFGELRSLPKDVDTPAPTAVETLVSPAVTQRGLPAAEGSTMLTARVLATQPWNGYPSGRYLSVELDVEAMAVDYSPGHCVALHPTNDPDLVRELLRALRLNAQTRVRTGRGHEPLWQVLLERLNLCHAPQALYATMSMYARNEDELSSIMALSPNDSGRTRSVGALLRRFPQLRPPVEEVLASLTPLSPTLAPIASTPAESRVLSLLLDLDDEAHPGGPKSVLAKRCVPGEWLSFTLDKRTSFPFLGDDLAALVLISDAWGMAYARSLLVQRQLGRARGRNWLIALGGSVATLPYLSDLQSRRRTDPSPRIDVLSGLAEQERDPHLLDLEETLWRWIVDRSILVVSMLDKQREREVLAWLCAIIMRRARLDATAANARIESMKTQGLLLCVSEMPPWPDPKQHAPESMDQASSSAGDMLKRNAG